MANVYRRINASGSGSSGGASPYTETFNSTSSWSGPSGGEYVFTVLQSTHLKGAEPMVQVYELIGSNYIQVDVGEIEINGSGDVSIKVTENIDTRFAGKVLIV